MCYSKSSEWNYTLDMLKLNRQDVQTEYPWVVVTYSLYHRAHTLRCSVTARFVFSTGTVWGAE